MNVSEQTPIGTLRELAELAESMSTQVSACKALWRASKSEQDEAIIRSTLRYVQQVDRGSAAVAAAALELELDGPVATEAEMFLLDLPCNRRGPCDRSGCTCDFARSAS